MTQDTTSCALDIDNEETGKAAIEAVETSPFPLLDLPPELRAAILEFVLPKDQLIKITPALKLPTLAGVSRKIRAEVLDTWYRCNRFCTETEYRDADFRSTFEMHLMQLGDLPAIAKWIELKGVLVQVEERAMHRVYWRLYRREAS